LINPFGVEVFHPGNILSEICPDYRSLVEFSGDELECMPSLGLLMMGAYFPAEIEVSYIQDHFYYDFEHPETPAYFAEDFDLVALSGFTMQIPRAYQIADHFRKKDSTVIIGGQHASSLPQEAKTHCDAVIAGEGEDVFPRALKDWLQGQLKPFYYSQKNIPGELIPSPRFELLTEIARYNKVPVQATRGCPYNCEFCSIKAVYGSRYRMRPVANVIRDLEKAKALFPHPHISFADENMLVDTAYAKELVTAMIPLGLTWEAYADITVARNPELLDLLRVSGCLELEIGLETVNPESLKAVSPFKAGQIEKYPEMIKTIQDHGVGVMGLFVVGFDQDGPDTFERLWDFMETNRIFEADLAVLNPLPGSPLYTRLKEEGRILSEDWGRYTWTQINFQPKLMSVEELKKGMLRLHKKSHSKAWEQLRNSPLNPRFARECQGGLK